MKLKDIKLFEEEISSNTSLFLVNTSTNVQEYKRNKSQYFRNVVVVPISDISEAPEHFKHVNHLCIDNLNLSNLLFLKGVKCNYLQIENQKPIDFSGEYSCNIGAIDISTNDFNKSTNLSNLLIQNKHQDIAYTFGNLNGFQFVDQLEQICDLMGGDSDLEDKLVDVQNYITSETNFSFDFWGDIE